MVLVVLAVAAVGGALYVKSGEKVSSQPSANYNPQTKTTTNGTAGGSGGIVSTPASTATNTQSAPAASAAQPTSSASGVITINTPTAGATISNGTTVSGTASGLSQVQYRIKDTVRGVIASGQLPVTNGSFSGTIQGLEPSSSSGTLEVYDYKNGNGPEENDAEINVSFK